MGNWAILQALVFEPRKAFAEIAERPRFLFPLLLVIIASVGLTIWYTGIVDLEWMIDRQLRAAPAARQLTEVQIEQRVASMSGRRGVTVTVAALGTCFALVIVTLLSALYYSLAGKITNLDRSYRQWLALTCWSGVPAVLAVIPAAFVLMSAGSGQIPQESLQPLSLNGLLFHRAPGEPGFSLLSSLNLLQIASVCLAAVGVKVWSGRSWLFSAVFVALPLLLIFGIWGFFAFR